MYCKAFSKLTIFLFGATGYCLIELIWRGHTHWSMFLTGGACFSLLEGISRTTISKKPLVVKCFAGASIITAAEFVTGCVVNLWLGLDVWDYTRLPFNLLGQISLPYSFLWFLLCAPLFPISKIIGGLFKTSVSDSAWNRKAI